MGRRKARLGHPKGIDVINLIDWILNLFRHEDEARAFVAAPEQSLRDAGLAGVPAAQLSAVVATAVPGMVLGDGDPVVGLQRAVSNHHGFAPAAEWSPSYAPSNEWSPTYAPSNEWSPSYTSVPTFAPSPTFAPETNTDLLSHNQTDLASHNDTAWMSPDQSAGANAQQGGFNLGFGDIIFGGSKTTADGDGAVAVTGHVHGTIVSGDGAVSGDGNDVNNGAIHAGTGSNVAMGKDNMIHDRGSATVTSAGGDAITTGDSGSVIKGSDNDVRESVRGDSSLIGGSQTTTTVGGHGNTTTADGHQATTTATSTTVTRTTTTVDDHSSVNSTTVVDDHVDNSVFDSSRQSLFDNSHDTTLYDSALDNSHDLSLASGNHLLGF
jgi:hypothetical protein